MQFLDTASQLHIYTIQQCAKFPKRYTFFVSMGIAQSAERILKLVKAGNSYYPTNAKEVQDRRDCFLSAYAETQCLISLINDAKETFPISGSALTGWMELIQSEIGLIKGVLKADKQRFKNLCGKDKTDNTNDKDKKITPILNLDEIE